MGKTRRGYPPEFRRQIIELVREFEPSLQSIRNWVPQTDRDERRREIPGTTGDE